ncbi:unnamed protein product [Lactuca virosa]|uniref:Uncharacterized protein n=1 Tax=Lactuca virosa TaxID=75947 RepID=A0AAU9NCR8_9ASTR|nr:unnamed protein product [Lactuca virosa]
MLLGSSPPSYLPYLPSLSFKYRFLPFFTDAPSSTYDLLHFPIGATNLSCSTPTATAIAPGRGAGEAGGRDGSTGRNDG